MQSLTHGSSGLLLGYALAIIGVVAGLQLRGRGRLWTAPLLAIPILLLAAVLWSAVRGLLFPHASGRLLELTGALWIVLASVLGGSVLMRRPLRGVEFLRGARVGHAVSGSAPAAAPGTLTLAGQPVPPADETKHFKLIGTTGTGKSTAIRELLAGALARGDRAVIADPDGGYLRAFYDPARGDRILNPCDTRAVRWDLFGELRVPQDAEHLARSLVPDHEGSDRSWRAYARTFLASVLRQMHRAGRRDMAELYRLLIHAPAEELRVLLAPTPAAPFLGEEIGKFLQSVRSVATAQLAGLEDLASHQAAQCLSVRQWVREGRGVLFLPYRATQIAALRQILSSWMRLAIFECMDGEEGDQRLWFIVDELDALGVIDGLKDALARLRKFGGRCVLGLQSIAQVSGAYGDPEAHTIVENSGNTLILRCSASERGGTAEFASRLIGRREVVRHQVSRTRSRERTGRLHESTTASEHYATEEAVMAAEIEQLADGQGFLKFASQPDWQRVSVGLPGAHIAGGTPAVRSRTDAQPALGHR